MEQEEDSVYSILELTDANSKNYKTKLYNIDTILSISCRVNSRSETHF